MKQSLLIFLLAFYSCLAFGQSESETFRNKKLYDTALYHTESKRPYLQKDFPKLLTQTNNSVVYGFIGNNFQRLRIKIISVKPAQIAYGYTIYGKSMVKGNVCEFHGIVNITNIRKYKVTSNGVDDMYKNAGLKGQFIIIGTYLFAENKKQKYSGEFKGVFATRFYINKSGHIKYDDIDSVSDSFTNNQFVGTWSEYGSKTSKLANWGNFRIPNSGDLDIGAGEFSPNDKYLGYGWQSRRDAMDQGSAGYKKAKDIEMAKWWQ